MDGYALVVLSAVGGILLVGVLWFIVSKVDHRESSSASVSDGQEAAAGDRDGRWDDRATSRFHAKAELEVSRGPRPPKSRFEALVREENLHHAWSEADREIHEAADREFESVVSDTVPPAARERAFYSKVAGASHRNNDRTSRPRIIDECSVFESLLLRPEPRNKFDPNAIAVRRMATGEQLGYIEAELAAEITADRAKHGPRWMAVLRHKNFSPETGKVAGATIYLIRLSDEYVLQKEAEAPGSVIA